MFKVILILLVLTSCGTNRTQFDIKELSDAIEAQREANEI